MDEIIFREEADPHEVNKQHTNSAWSLLVVDDEADVHTMTKMILENYSFKERGVKLYHAYSLKEAKEKFTEVEDIALVLLDVVMEDIDSGFKFIEFVREKCNNHLVRIILRTGQPGYAPEREAIFNYDINDYISKSTADATRFLTATTTAIRSYQDMVTIEEMRRNLEEKVEERTAQLLEKTNELEKLVIEVEKSGTIDHLTGIYNRREFHFQAAERINQCKRYKHELSIIVFDIDLFKRINDVYGHNVGDEVLIDFTNIVSSLIRACDVFARWGGEEFILLLPETDIKQVETVAEKIRKSIEEHDFNHVGKVTSSFGVTLHKDSDSMEGFIKRADDALYMAKNAGRNNVQTKI